MNRIIVMLLALALVLNGGTILGKSKKKEMLKEKHLYVDLGLPSGTRWATCNIGAKTPTDNGLYFSWGSIKGRPKEKPVFNKDNYRFYGYKKLLKYNCTPGLGLVDSLTELELKDDAAYVMWGEHWRIPSKEQFLELINPEYTIVEWTTFLNVKGRRVRSKKNGMSVFFPAAGYCFNNKLRKETEAGGYWSRSLDPRSSDAVRMGFGLDLTEWRGFNRFFGRTIRPIYVGEESPSESN